MCLMMAKEARALCISASCSHSDGAEGFLVKRTTLTGRSESKKKRSTLKVESSETNRDCREWATGACHGEPWMKLR